MLHYGCMADVAPSNVCCTARIISIMIRGMEPTSHHSTAYALHAALLPLPAMQPSHGKQAALEHALSTSACCQFASALNSCVTYCQVWWKAFLSGAPTPFPGAHLSACKQPKHKGTDNKKQPSDERYDTACWIVTTNFHHKQCHWLV